MKPTKPTLDGDEVCNTCMACPADLLTADGMGGDNLWVYKKPDGTYLSFWKPSIEELHSLMNGQVVVLTVHGMQPPVDIQVTESLDFDRPIAENPGEPLNA